MSRHAQLLGYVVVEPVDAQARSMRYKMPDRQFVLGRMCGESASGGVVTIQNLRVVPLRQILGDRLIQLNLTFLKQRHKRHSDDGFGLRCHAENIRRLAGNLLLDVAITEGFQISYFAVFYYHRHALWHIAVVHVRVVRTVHISQAFRIKRLRGLFGASTHQQHRAYCNQINYSLHIGCVLVLSACIRSSTKPAYLSA